MQKSTLNQLPEKSFKEIIHLFWRVLWHNFFYHKLNKLQNNKVINPKVQKLHLEAHKIKSELAFLESDLAALPYIKGKLIERNVTDRKTGKVRNFHVIRWYEGGIRKEKYIVKQKRKDADINLSEANVLVANAVRAEQIEAQIKERKIKIVRLEDRLTALSGAQVKVDNPIREMPENYLIGRDKEFTQLQNHLLHNISTLLIGEPGIGKSYLLKNLIESQTRPVLWIENLKAARSVLIESVIDQLHRDGNLEIDDGSYCLALSLEDLKSKCLKNKTIDQLAAIVEQSIINKDYIAAINSMAGLTQTNQVIIDRLLEAGIPVFACTNRIKPSIELESIYRRFTKLEIEPLSNKDLRTIITNKVANIRVDEENRQILSTKIVNAAAGNPGVADKMLKDAQALSLGGSLTYNQVQSIQEPYLPRKYFDLTPVILFAIAGFAILRFVGIGTNDTLLYVIGGICFVLFMAFGRLMLRAWKG